jgi:LEA14-like dessication related protein
MKQKTAFIAVGAGALALVGLYYSGLLRTAKSLTVSIFGAKYNSSRTQDSIFTKIWFDLKLKVTNPTSRPVTVNETLLDFFVNGKKVGEVRNYDKQTIAPKVYSYLIVPTYFVTLSIFPLVADFLQKVKDKKPLAMEVKGSLNIEGNKINVDEKISLDLTPLSAAADYLKRLFGK